MKSHFLVDSRLIVAVLGATALAAGFFSSSAQADQWDKKTILTVNEPVQVQDTLLQPGQYVFKLQDTNADRHVVQIFNGDQTQIINTILAIPNYRLQPAGSSRFAFWETPPGSARALRAWFYPGDNFGQEFRYPKHLRELAVVTPPPAVVAVAPVPEPQVVAPAPEPQPAPQVLNEQPPQAEAPVEIAQNNAPAPPPAVEPAPAPVPEPQVLPKTASPYPMIGLIGLLALGLSAFLRIKRFV